MAQTSSRNTVVSCVWAILTFTLAVAQTDLSPVSRPESIIDHDEPYGAVPELSDGTPIKECYLSPGDKCGCRKPKAWCSHCKCEHGYVCSSSKRRCVHDESEFPRQAPVDGNGGYIQPWECALSEGEGCQLPVKSLSGYCWCKKGLKCQNNKCVKMTAEEKSMPNFPKIQMAEKLEKINSCVLAREGMECECKRKGSFCKDCDCKTGMRCHNNRCMYPFAARIMGGTGPGGELMPWDKSCRLSLDEACQVPVRNRNGYCWCDVGLECVDNVCVTRTGSNQNQDKDQDKGPRIVQQQQQIQQVQVKG